MVTRAEQNPFPYALLMEQDDADVPTPATTGWHLFVDEADGLLKLKDDAGSVASIGGGLTDPMTTRGDIIVRNAANATARLAIGSSGKVLSSDGTDVSWQPPAAADPTFVGWRLTATGITMTSGAAWKVPFASESGGRDTHAFHDTSSNNTRCTIPSGKDGLYRVTFNVRFPGAFTGATWIGIAVGNTWLTPGQFQPNDAAANTDRQASVSCVVDLVATNYVECGGLFCATTRTDLAVEFSGQWLGA